VGGGILGELPPKELWGCLKELALMVLYPGHQVLVVLFKYRRLEIWLEAFPSRTTADSTALATTSDCISSASELNSSKMLVGHPG